MANVQFHPAARNDFEEALAWYAERSPLAAGGFADELQAALDRITDDPTRWPLIDKCNRRHPLNRYPYAVVYRIEDDVVTVVAVAHGRRRQSFWRGR